MNEKSIQQIIAKYLDLRGWLWMHPPNGGWRDIKTARALKSEGVKPGVPDIIIFDRPPKAAEKYIGTALELKTEKGLLSQSQKDWLATLNERGWLTLVGQGLNVTINMLKSYGY